TRREGECDGWRRSSGAQEADRRWPPRYRDEGKAAARQSGDKDRTGRTLDHQTAILDRQRALGPDLQRLDLPSIEKLGAHASRWRDSHGRVTATHAGALALAPHQEVCLQLSDRD